MSLDSINSISVQNQEKLSDNGNENATKPKYSNLFESQKSTTDHNQSLVQSSFDFKK